MSSMPTRGGFGQPGGRIFSIENLRSEIIQPGIAALFLALDILLFVWLVRAACLMFGPSSWFIAPMAAVAIVGGAIAVRQVKNGADIWWPIIVVVLSIAGIVAWAIFGDRLVRSIWPHTQFSGWLFGISIFNKIWISLGFAGVWFCQSWVGWRWAVEIVDPTHSQRHVNNAQGTGLQPVWPGTRRYREDLRPIIQDREAEIEELEAAIEELETTIESLQHARPAVQIVLNGNPDDPPVPEGPNGPHRLASYFLAVQNQVADLSLNGALRFGFKRGDAEELMAWLVECPEGSPQKYAYKSKRGDPTLLNLGRWMMREYIKKYKPDANGNGHTEER